MTYMWPTEWPTLSAPLPNPQLRVTSFGAGEKSSTLALATARVDVSPMPDCLGCFEVAMVGTLRASSVELRPYAKNALEPLLPPVMVESMAPDVKAEGVESSPPAPLEGGELSEGERSSDAFVPNMKLKAARVVFVGLLPVNSHLAAVPFTVVASRMLSRVGDSVAHLLRWNRLVYKIPKLRTIVGFTFAAAALCERSFGPISETRSSDTYVDGCETKRLSLLRRVPLNVVKYLNVPGKLLPHGRHITDDRRVPRRVAQVFSSLRHQPLALGYTSMPSMPGRGPIDFRLARSWGSSRD